MNFAGKDATSGFEPVHPKDIVKILPSNAYIGDVDASTVSKERETTQTQTTVNEVQMVDGRPHVSYLINVFDFEAVAKQVMKKESWDYYSSGSDDEITLRENHSAFQRIWLKPRVLVNVGNIDMRCNLLGNPSSFPLYITATALAKLAHPEGEVVLTRAAHSQGIIQMCPTLASCSLDEMIAARKEGQSQWFQLYVNRDRNITKEIVQKAERGGMKGLFITVDAPQLGRREKDMRNKFLANPPDLQKSDKINRNQGTARAISQFIDPTLNWDDIKWFKSITKMPIVLKGVQCAEDAVLAVQHGVQGIVLSNHGL